MTTALLIAALYLLYVAAFGCDGAAFGWDIHDAGDWEPYPRDFGKAERLLTDEQHAALLASLPDPRTPGGPA